MPLFYPEKMGSFYPTASASHSSQAAEPVLPTANGLPLGGSVFGEAKNVVTQFFRLVFQKKG
jgi:hypothetical protein